MTKRVADLSSLPSCLKEGRLCAVVNTICPFTEDDKETLLNVLRHTKNNNRVFYRFYCDHGHELANLMLANKNTDWQKVVDWEYGVVALSKEKGYAEGMTAYFLGVLGMLETFWTSCEDPLFTDLHARKDADFKTLDTQWTKTS